MPELPEVETARRAVEDYCMGKKIQKAVVADDQKVIDGVSAKDFEVALVGKTIVGVHRKGKNMWIQLDSPPHPSFQFGMAGAVYIKGVAVTKYKRSAVKDTDEWPSKYSKLYVELDNGLEFSFTDKRRFAKVRLLENPLSVTPISELGPDALTEPMTVDNFFTSLMKKKIGIKALLLDQHFISGIGNWMADEVLYQARIHPLQIASSIPKECCATLLNCINEVTEKAIEVEADNSQFPSNWISLSREKKPGKAFVDGKKIEFISAGGRTTAYVPQLQKLVPDHVVKDITKQSKEGSNSGGDVDVSEKHNPKEPEVRKGRKSGRGKKSSVKSKLNAGAENSDDDEGDVDADYALSKRSKPTKRRPAKRKPKKGTENEEGKRPEHEQIDDKLDNPIGNDDQDEDTETEVKNGKRTRAVASSSRKTVASRRNDKVRN